MVNTRWTLGLAVFALAIFGASSAHALTPYVHEGPDAACSSKSKTCCAKDAAGHRVGSFDLEGIAQDKAAGAVCSTKAGNCGVHAKKCPVTCVGSKLGEIVSGPFILADAALNDAYLLLTMPYRKAEPIN